MKDLVSTDLRALLEGIAYGDDPKITPGDRLRAAEQLQLLPDEGTDQLMREVLPLSPAAVQAEYDAYVARHKLPELLAGGNAADEWPLTAAALEQAVDERASARVRELTDPARIEREIEERAQARAETMYRERAFRAVTTAAPVQAGAGAETRDEASTAEPATQAPPGPPPGATWDDVARPWRRRRRDNPFRP